MGDFLSAGVAIVSAKFLTIMAAFSMAIVSVGLDARRHSFPSAVLAIFAGTIVGVISASSLLALFNLPEQVGYGIASIAAVSANNLVRWLLVASQDPLGLWANFRGKK